MDYAYFKELLIDKGISLRKLAEIIGVSYNTLSANVRRESKKIPIETVMKIAEALDVEWWVLMGWDDYGGGVYAKEADESVYAKIHEHYDTRQDELIKAFHCLNDEGKSEALKRIKELTELSRYRR